jgi:hypothetical protein
VSASGEAGRGSVCYGPTIRQRYLEIDLTAKVSIKPAQQHARTAAQQLKRHVRSPYSPQEAPVDSYQLSSILHWVGLIVRCSRYIKGSLSVASASTLFLHLLHQTY